MKLYRDTFLHAILVGLITAVVIIICGWFSIKSWIVFFAWANYFLHGSNFKKSVKMLLAICIGIFSALLATKAITYSHAMFSSEAQLYVTACIIFVVATFLIFLECIKNWGEMVPATFLGTVLFFASGVEIQAIFPELIVPLIGGILVGLLTVVSRQKLNELLHKPKP